jgi:Domain of unknown function (DUF4430)
MHQRINLALGGALLAAVLALSPAAVAASAPTVIVRVEGKARTLLAPTATHTHSGSITKGGAAPGACPASSGQGALDVSTHHRWSGKFDTSLGSYFVTTILGDTESGTQFFWEIFVNNVAASVGGCEIKLKPGDQLLFAVVPATGTAFPTALSAPGTATVGHSFTVKVQSFTASGKAKPLAGARVDGKLTSSRGTVRITPTKSGTLVLQATHKGYVRSAPTRVHVS